MVAPSPRLAQMPERPGRTPSAGGDRCAHPPTASASTPCARR